MSKEEEREKLKQISTKKRTKLGIVATKIIGEGRKKEKAKTKQKIQEQLAQMSRKEQENKMKLLFRARYLEEAVIHRNKREESLQLAKSWITSKTEHATFVSSADQELANHTNWDNVKIQDRLLQAWRTATRSDQQRPWDAWQSTSIGLSDRDDWAQKNVDAARRWATNNPGLAFAEDMNYYINFDVIRDREEGRLIEEDNDFGTEEITHGPAPGVDRPGSGVEHKSSSSRPMVLSGTPNFPFSGGDQDWEVDNINRKRLEYEMDSGDEDENDAIQEAEKVEKHLRRAQHLMGDKRSSEVFHVLRDLGFSMSVPHILKIRKAITIDSKDPSIYLGHINYSKMRDSGVREMAQRILKSTHVNDQFISALRAAQHTINPNLYLKHRTELLTKIHQATAEDVYKYMIDLRKLKDDNGSNVYDENRVFTLGHQRLNDILEDQIRKVNAAYPLQ